MWFYLVATVVIGGLLYKLLSRPSNQWKKHGIPEIDTSPAVGALDVMLGRKTMVEGDKYAYNKLGPDGKFCGIRVMGTDVLLVKDMELIKKVLIKDFDHFVDRRKLFHSADGILEKMLFNLEGDEWKGVRSSFSPTFTTGKIRRMMGYFNSVGLEWVEEYTRKAKSSGGSVVIDVMNSVNQYTLDVISNTVFGMNAGIIKNPDSVFSKTANKISDFGNAQTIKFGLRFMFPRLSRLLGFSIIDFNGINYFEKILERELKARLKGEAKRNDFLQLMVEAKKGELKASGSDELDSFEKDAQISSASSQKKNYLTEEMMTAQSVVFFFAGFSSTSSVITFTLYALALHMDVQRRLREEVDKIVKEDGTLDYDDVGHLVYMDMVVNEVMRILFGSSRMERLCVKDYKDPESGLFVPKGTIVGIPTSALHHDKQYYDNPEKFDPEHFAAEKKAARNPYAFMPFGMGPRNCIGMRFAQIEVKAVIAHIIHSFIVEPTPKTPVPFQGKPAGLQIVPPKNLEVRLTPINK